MSSFKKAAKTAQKNHRERSQLSSRSHLGLLEKKKDYRLRAKDYHKKQDTLKKLKQKALNRNPDEFYFKMVNSRLQDGRHRWLKKDDPKTEEQELMLETQDMRYVNHKLAVEAKKIEQLKSTLHLTDCGDSRPKNKHIFFTDTKKEAAEFDAAKHLDTHPALLHRTYNRPTTAMLESHTFPGTAVDEEVVGTELQELSKLRRKKYKELTQRIDRERELNIIAQKMQGKRNQHDKGKKVLVKGETKESAAVYKWQPARKR
ncbi:probable U3 small nucleolar RNA-associated protein 11 [Amphiura filiformis]|uniref:probable U3 small nucleolar RNA-associated protein 11 n=1 Tax=Amphiura filiformis TaxID=82378 RepID=UPI003B225253